jgi:hypothetical protein
LTGRAGKNRAKCQGGHPFGCYIILVLSGSDRRVSHGRKNIWMGDKQMDYLTIE